jgi:hypothetical protein
LALEEAAVVLWELQLSVLVLLVEEEEVPLSSATQDW